MPRKPAKEKAKSPGKPGPEPRKEGTPLRLTGFPVTSDVRHWLNRLRTRAAMFQSMDGVDRDASELAKRTEKMAALALNALTQEKAGAAVFATAMALETAWMTDVLQGLMPKLLRDQARQAATRKPRGIRRPALSAWLDQLLADDATLSNKALWREVRQPGAHPEISLDGENILEEAANQSLSFSGFEKQVTAARKRHAAKKRRK